MSDESNDRPDAGESRGPCLIGFQVEATDGHIGRVDQHADEVRPAHLVVDTGPWILGSRVLLPIGTVTRVDEREQKVYLDRSREEIKSAPAFDARAFEEDEAHRRQIGLYYGLPFG